MLLGTAITPIKGLGLPGFGELRYPMVLVAGDTEVASAVAPVMMHTGDRPFCSPFGGCGTTPTFSSVPPRDYLTVTHADAALGRSAQLNVRVPPTPIFTLGLLTLFLEGSGTLTIGGGGCRGARERSAARRYAERMADAVAHRRACRSLRGLRCIATTTSRGRRCSMSMHRSAARRRSHCRRRAAARRSASPTRS